MDKKEVAAVLDEIGTLLELKGENPFKCRAYYNAARTILALDKDIDEVVASGELGTLKGIGEALAKKITELVTMGHLKYYEELKASVPEGVVEMMAIPTLGPKKVKALYDRLGIKSIGELEYAINEHRLDGLEGFAAKTIDNIVRGVEHLRKHADQHLYHQAEAEAAPILAALKKSEDVIQVSVAGSLRRHKETIRDIDFVASTAKSPRVMDLFTSLPSVERILMKGDTKSSIQLNSGINSDLRTVPDAEFASALMYLTGSKDHNIAMRQRAIAHGYKLNEYGLFKGERRVPTKDEAAIFAKLRLAYIAPELREDMGEIDAAENNALPALIEEKDVRGTLHAHTTYSDASGTLEQMARAAQRLGYEYLGIADHSQSAKYAGGLEPQRVKQQQAGIDALNKKFKRFRLLKGIEVDILPDGSLDYADRILATFDFVIVAVHSKFNMSEAEMTRRIIKAMRNKYVTILAHPTGRLLLAREPYPVDMHKVIDAAADLGVLIEINTHPQRFDLDWRLGKYAKSKGLKVALCPDAHSVEDLAYTRYGVGIARKGWLGADDVVNTLDADALLNLFAHRRKRK